MGGGNPETLEFLKTVLGEICEVFPSKYIHIGGDECPKNRWYECPVCQAKIKGLGLVDKDGKKFSKENQLQSYINREIEEFIKSHGRDIIGWDEILEGGLSGSSIVMSWRGVKGGIAAASKIYSFEPLIPEELTPEQQRLILGPQVNLWTEHVKYPAHVFYQLLPRLGASSEVQWSLPEQKDFEDFKERLPHLKEIYEVLGVPYCKLLE